MNSQRALLLGATAICLLISGVAWAAQRLEINTDYIVTLGRNVILADTPFVRVFDVHKSIRVSVDAENDAADIDVLLRRGQPMDESTVGNLFDSATIFNDGPGGDKELVIARGDTPRLTSGKWYVQLINRTGPETPVGFKISATRDGEGGGRPATAEAQPLPGMWYNPGRDGHGLDIQRSGDQLFVTWYTYDSTGRPVWYLAVGEMNGSSWEADLLEFEAIGTKADGKLDTASAVVGTVGLEFLDSRNAQLSYEIAGTSGVEPLTPLVVSNMPPVENLTGHYYSPSDPGWGYTLNTQGRQLFTVIYYYDNAGLPRWVLGSMERPLAAKGQKNEFKMDVLQFYGGPGPGGLNTAPEASPAGQVTITESSIKTDIHTAKPDVRWLRDRISEALSDVAPPYVFSHIQGPTFVGTNDTASYAAKVDTDAPVEELSYTWNRFGATISSGIDTGSSTILRTGSQTGLATLQLDVRHEPSGVSTFVTKNVSVQEADGIFTAAIQGDPRPVAGLSNRYTAQIFGGQPPYRHRWTVPTRSSETQGMAVDLLFNSPVDGKPLEIPLILNVTDGQGDTATATLTVRPRVYQEPEFRVLGPAVVDSGQPATYVIDPLRPGSEPLLSWEVGGTTDEHGRVIERGCNAGDVSCTVRWTGGTHVVAATMKVKDAENQFTRVKASKEVAVDQGLISATFVTSPFQLKVDQSGQFVIDIRGGQPPFDVIIDFDGDGLGEGFQTRSRTITRTHSYDRARQYSYAARVTDSNLQSSSIGGVVRVVDADPEPPGGELEVRIVSSASRDFCHEDSLEAEILGGEPPFFYVWDFGDGTVMDGTTSSRTLEFDHMFSASVNQQPVMVLEVEDDVGNVVEDRQTVTHEGQVEKVTVRLRNRGVDNIHIYNRDRLSPGQFFSSFTRISNGSFRDEDISVPADRCGTVVHWGAGRQGTQRATASCPVTKGEPGGSVIYDEQAFNVLPTLVCGS